MQLRVSHPSEADLDSLGTLSSFSMSPQDTNTLRGTRVEFRDQEHPRNVLKDFGAGQLHGHFLPVSLHLPQRNLLSKWSEGEEQPQFLPVLTGEGEMQI